MKTKIQIKSILGVLFEFEKEENTLKNTLEEAVKNRAFLNGASLNGASLNGAFLNGAKGIDANRCTPLRILMDQPGLIRAYKLVNEKGEGIYAAANGYSPINYFDAEEFAVENCNQDEAKQCGAGISVATLDWCMQEWREGCRILLMEFTAADIAAIPIATDGKFRVRRCRRVGEKDLKELGLIKSGDVL